MTYTIRCEKCGYMYRSSSSSGECPQCASSKASIGAEAGAAYHYQYSETAKDVTKQSHYTQFKIQPAVFIGENNIGYFEGNVIKYVCRYQKKNGIEDLKKAKHYLEMLISKVETGEVKV